MSLSAPREQECGGKDDEGIRSFSQSSTLAFFFNLADYHNTFPERGV